MTTLSNINRPALTSNEAIAKLHRHQNVSGKPQPVKPVPPQPAADQVHICTGHGQVVKCVSFAAPDEPVAIKPGHKPPHKAEVVQRRQASWGVSL